MIPRSGHRFAAKIMVKERGWSEIRVGLSRVLSAELLLAQHLLDPPERRVRRGHPGVDRRLQEERAQLLNRDAVPERRADMELELLLAVERDHHRERHHRARLPGDGRVAPDLAPGDPRDEILPRHRERAGLRKRALDMLGPEHALTVREARLEAGCAGALRLA